MPKTDQNFIYLDHAATTKVDPKVKNKMLPFWEAEFGNPSSLYKLGQKAKVAVENSRQQIAEILKAEPEEIIFTGSGTQSCNLAIQGTAQKHQNHGKHIITSKIEHHAVLNTCKKLEQTGYDVTYLDVDQNGFVDPQDVKNSLQDDTILVSIMYANNEIGTIEPIEEISKVISKFKNSKPATQNQLPFFHTDACQAAGYLSLNTSKLGVDLMTLNGSKIYGPKGVGVLYKAKKAGLEPITYGGEQEFEFNPGTENVANYVGMGEALRLVQSRKKKELPRLKKLRDFLIKNIEKKIESVQLNGPRQKRLPFNAHFIIKAVEGEALLLWLDKYNIYASTGSACTSSQLKPSHVLEAIGVPRELSHGSLRLSLGKNTTQEEIDTTIEKLQHIVKKLREISPLS